MRPIEGSDAYFLFVPYNFHRPKMADGQFIMGFRCSLLGSSLFVHIDPLRLRWGTVCDGWEHLGVFRRRSWEEFANNG